MKKTVDHTYAAFFVCEEYTHFALDWFDLSKWAGITANVNVKRACKPHQQLVASVQGMDVTDFAVPVTGLPFTYYRYVS